MTFDNKCVMWLRFQSKTKDTLPLLKHFRELKKPTYILHMIDRRGME